MVPLEHPDLFHFVEEPAFQPGVEVLFQPVQFHLDHFRPLLEAFYQLESPIPFQAPAFQMQDLSLLLLFHPGKPAV